MHLRQVGVGVVLAARHFRENAGTRALHDGFHERRVPYVAGRPSPPDVFVELQARHGPAERHEVFSQTEGGVVEGEACEAVVVVGGGAEECGGVLVQYGDGSGEKLRKIG